MPSTHSPRKSAERAAFEHYLRTGEALTPAEWLARRERKFNPYHDELGRFTFAHGAVAPARMADRPQNKNPAAGRAARPPAQPPAARPRRIAAITGYPETGKTAWRSSNDAAFAAAADYYNQKYGLKPGQEEYRTAEFMKAWAMRESGGEGDEDVFRTDPFQVNVVGDWVPEKQPLVGVRYRQKMTPTASAYSALEWLRYKSYTHDSKGQPMRFLGNLTGLQNYNTRTVVTRQSEGLPHKVWYARSILQMAAQASGAGK